MLHFLIKKWEGTTSPRRRSALKNTGYVICCHLQYMIYWRIYLHDQMAPEPESRSTQGLHSPDSGDRIIVETSPQLLHGEHLGPSTHPPSTSTLEPDSSPPYEDNQSPPPYEDMQTPAVESHAVLNLPLPPLAETCSTRGCVLGTHNGISMCEEASSHAVA